MIYTITEFDQEAFEKFQDKINTLPKDEKLTVFINSTGGSVNTKDMYKDVLHSTANVEVV